MVGNGAILESTNILGPHKNTIISPKTGEKLVTLASEDKTFEFHLKPDQVSKISFIERPKPIQNGEDEILRICRLINREDVSICSLIMCDSSPNAASWFKDMSEKYGDYST